MEWSIVSKAADRSSRDRRERDSVFIESREKVIDDLEKGCLGVMTDTIS